jgi:transketolase
MSITKIIQISKELDLSHIGSCISTYGVLEQIYSVKEENDLVLLDNCHAHLAHLMFTHPNDTLTVRKKYGTHCDTRAGCVVNGGSLGHALGIAIGIALTNRKRDIYVVLSDGSMMEGSNWEALRIREELGLSNIKCYFNFNGNSALAELDLVKLTDRVYAFCPDAFICLTSNGEGYEGVSGHYIK